MFTTRVVSTHFIIRLIGVCGICSGAFIPDSAQECFDGVCVKPNMCENNTVLTYGEGHLDVRASIDYGEPRYCAVGERCCLLNDDSDAPVMTAQYEEELVPTKHVCGIRNYDPTKEGDGEGTAQFAEFPWMVAILIKRPADAASVLPKQQPQQQPSFNLTTLSARSQWTTPTTKQSSPKPPPPPSSSSPKFDFRCGGSLIHPRVVLTAAHCVDAIPHARLVARAGEWDTRRTDERLPHENRDVQRVTVHPHYYSRTVHNDIALLFLTEAVRLGLHINTVCLPPPPPHRRFSTSSNRCLVSGWGKNNFGRAGRFQAVLKRVELPIVERDTCLRALRRTKLGRFFRLHNSFICAGGEAGSDTCKGDGGSPLVCPMGSSEDGASLSAQELLRHSTKTGGDVEFRQLFYQAGIVSWGVGCNEQVPAAYVNVAAFRSWIDGEMATHGWDTGFYTARHDGKD